MKPPASNINLVYIVGNDEDGMVDAEVSPVLIKCYIWSAGQESK